MATIGPIAGVAFVKVNGQQIQLIGSLSITVGGQAATGRAGQDGMHGYTEKTIEPKIEFEQSDSAGVSLVALQAIRGATVQAELANGKVYVLQQAFTNGTITLDGTEGKIKGAFGGTVCVEQGVSA